MPLSQQKRSNIQSFYFSGIQAYGNKYYHNNGRNEIIFVFIFSIKSNNLINKSK